MVVVFRNQLMFFSCVYYHVLLNKGGFFSDCVSSVNLSTIDLSSWITSLSQGCSYVKILVKFVTHVFLVQLRHDIFLYHVCQYKGI